MKTLKRKASHRRAPKGRATRRRRAFETIEIGKQIREQKMKEAA
jgi:hypothetical protein